MKFLSDHCQNSQQKKLSYVDYIYLGAHLLIQQRKHFHLEEK